MPTAVPRPSLTDQGFIAPDEAAVLTGVQTDINTAFGGNLNSGLSTPQGQLASSEAAVIGDNNATFLQICNQVDPAFSSGRMQDAIARIYFISRHPAEPTVVQATCGGLAGVIIPVGALARAADGNLYVCRERGIIPLGGSITLSFACQNTGPITCPAGTLTTIYRAVFGWDTITNAADGALGKVVESRTDFETRRSESTGINSRGSLPAIKAAVLQVPGVLDAYATENDTAFPITVGGVSINPNSLYICVLGGDPQAVAQAIWSRKAPGCGYTGNTTQTVIDPSPDYNPPIPSYTVTFETPTNVPFYILVTLSNNASVPSDALTRIQNAIIAAFAGADGGSRARIGSIIYASRYYGPVAALGAWASRIVSIVIGTTQAAAFTGAVSGTTLTVSAIASGALASGQLLRDVSAHLLQGTTIVAQLTGAAGSTGTYSVSKSQTVASESMTSITLANDISLNINQAPTIVAAAINLLLV